MKNKFLKIALVLSAIILTTACTEDDATGDATNAPSSPSLTVSLDFEAEQSLVETETTYGFTVSISEAQITNVRVHLTQTGGDATKGEDFDFPSTVTIAAGTTSVSDVFTIHADDLAEETETATIQITNGTEANLNSISGTSVSFSIMNVTGDDLAIGMTWAASSTVTDNYGEAIGATDLADMRLLITDIPYTGILTSEDGAGFETLAFLGTYPDGEYYVVADFYDATDISTDLDITLTFDQVGKINGETHTFTKALSTDYVCSNNHNILAKVTKVGYDYTIEKVEINNIDSQAISWGGVDTYDFYAPDGWDSKITTAVDCDGTLIYGLNAEWMSQVWGEVIETEYPVIYTVDAAGVVTIEEQYLFITSWNGGLYRYSVSATGTIDDSGDETTMHLEYYLTSGTFDVGGYWFDQGGMDTPYFVADLVAQ